MDKLRIFVWAFFGLMLWLTWQAWQRDYPPRVPPAADAVAPEALPAEPIPELIPPASVPPRLPALPEALDASATAERTVSVQTDLVDYVISTRGGGIVEARMRRYPVAKDRPDELVSLLSARPGNFGVLRTGLRAAAGDGPGHDALFDVRQSHYELGDQDQLRVPLTWTGDDGISVVKEYVFSRGQYAIQLNQRVRNDSEVAWSADHYTQVLRRFRAPERSMFDVSSYSFDGPLFFDGKKAEKLSHKELAQPFTFTGANAYFAAIQQHFLIAVLPTPETDYLYRIAQGGERMTASIVGARQTVAPGETYTFERRLYVGPKLQSELKELHPKLALSVDYGFLTILSQPMFWLLDWVHGFVGNWGWAIIIVTLLIKLIFYKLTETSGRSMARMRELQPRMKVLQERYKDDRQALSQQMMELYKREKINPAAGCLPILIQMPFFLAFYWVLVESVEMRQAPFALWITDLSSRDPYFILPLVMGAAMFLQQRLNPAPTDPVQARVMQIMPIVFTGFFAFFPAGLVLYWVTNTILSIAQQWKINKLVEQEAKSKPRSKTRGKKAKADDA